MMELSHDNFEDTVSKGKVVVDFWAPWCAPCKIFAPVFEASAKEHSDITFAKLNTEDQPEIAQQAGIRAIPTLIFFENGKEIARQAGAMPKPMFEQKLKDVFK